MYVCTYVLIYVCRSDIRTCTYVYVHIYTYIVVRIILYLGMYMYFCVFLVTQCILRLIPGNHSMIHLVMVTNFLLTELASSSLGSGYGTMFYLSFWYVHTYVQLFGTYVHTYVRTCVLAYMHTTCVLRTYTNMQVYVRMQYVLTYEHTYLCRYNIVHT